MTGVYFDPVAIVDDDGFLDTVYVDGRSLEWLRGHGDGVFDGRQLLSACSGDVFVAADVDGDGVPDVVAWDSALSRFVTAFGTCR